MNTPMNTPMNDDRQQAIKADEARDVTPHDEARVTELGKVSDTQGGVWGPKFDSIAGWQYY